MQIQCSPFGEISKAELIAALAYSGLGLSMQSTPEQIYAALSKRFPNEVDLTNPQFIAGGGVILQGNTLSYTPTGSGYRTVVSYASYHDLTNLTYIDLEGYIQLGGSGKAAPYCKLELEPEDTTKSNIQLAYRQGSGNQLTLIPVEVNGLVGNYRLKVTFYTEVIAMNIIINKAIAKQSNQE